MFWKPSPDKLDEQRFLVFCVIGRLGRPPCCTRIFSRGLQGYLPHEFQSAHSIEAISQQLLLKCRSENTSSQLLLHVSNHRVIFARYLIISWTHDIQPHIELSCSDPRASRSTETKVVPACCIGSIVLLVTVSRFFVRVGQASLLQQ